MSVKTVAYDQRAKAPKGDTWRLFDTVKNGGDVMNRWLSPQGICVLSSYCVAETGRSKLLIPQWHISVSENGHRPGDDAVRSVLADFGMEDSEEDNHVPGKARHFWRLDVQGPHVECDCKRDEETVTELDGYRWQRKRE